MGAAGRPVTLTLSPARNLPRASLASCQTLSGRAIAKDPLQSAEGFSNFAAGWTVGGLSGVIFS